MAHKPPIMVKDDGDKLAVLANGKAATKWLGLENPSETKVSHLEVVNPETGEILFEDTVGEGKYFSAIWIQYQVHMSGADSLDVLYFNDVRKKHLKKYMGEIVIADAENPELENHAFVRALLSTDTVLHINITWKIKKDTKTMVFTRQSEITDSLTPVIEAAWENRADLSPESTGEYREAVEEAIHHLDDGTLRVASKQGKDWIVHQWLKKAVLLGFRLSPNDTMSGGPDGTMFFDKVESKFAGWDEERFEKAGFRVVPPAAVRRGSFIGKNAVIMPSYVNIGAYVGPGTMVDTWATVGSCAQIGENCHLSGGVGIGGVLEPLQANPTIIGAYHQKMVHTHCLALSS